MDLDQSKYMKANIKLSILDSHRARDMASVNVLMDKILEVFSEDIVWENLHELSRDTKMYKLQQIIKNVKHITVSSNQHAKELANDE